MTSLIRLSVIAVLTSTLALVGCGDDETSTAGSGGTAGTGGSGGAPLDVCGGEPPRTVEEGSEVDTETVNCLDTVTGSITVPIGITLAAQPTEALVNGENDFDMQIVFEIDEDTVAAIGTFGVGEAVIGASTVDVGGDNPADNDVTVAEAPVPCTVDFAADPDDNGAPGPITIVTPVTTGSFTVANDSVTLTAEEILFDIAGPVPLMLTTVPPDGTCTWDAQPSVTFNVGAGGSGGSGGAGGSGGTGGSGGSP